MAEKKKLDCVILGLLSHEALTGYEIKRRIDTTLHYFWSASYGSIYPTLSDLVHHGLAEKKDLKETKRKKVIYTITENGRKYLKEWLALPAQKDELRSETLLKLFFGYEQGEEQAILHIDAFQKKIEYELLYLLQAEKTLRTAAAERTHLYYQLTVQCGIKVYQAYLEWCEEAKKTLSHIGKIGSIMTDKEE